MKKRVLGGLMAILLFVIGVCPLGVQAEEDIWNVKVSDVDYSVELNNTDIVYICNRDSIGSKVGTEYYMTYTVESMAIGESRHQGVVGTNSPTSWFPYAVNEEEGGVYHWDVQNKLLVEGHTYFLKFVITEEGYNYRIGWAEGDQSRYIEFSFTTSEITKGLGYYGIFLADGGMTGKLTKVRCYDKNGNDLGVQVTPGKNATVCTELKPDTQVNHSYTLKLEDVYNVAISNQRIPTSDRVFMEYTVASSDSSVFQSGVIHTSEPKKPFPNESGILLYKQEVEVADIGKKENGILLEPGASYIIQFDRTEAGFHVIAQKTVNGKQSYLSFPISYGTYNKDASFFSLWFGQLDKCKINCVLKNFKCYDSNKNNLGVQCNQPAEIVHHGAREDYSGCEAVYYCDADNTLYALYANQKLTYTDGDKSLSGTYVIDEVTSEITIKINGKKEKYDYLYKYFTNSEGKKYRRLHVYTINFDTGTEETIEEQVLSAQNGYTVLRPTDPVIEGKNFEGWYTSDGEAFDFDKIITKSMTLHAKFDGEIVYTNKVVKLLNQANYIPYIAVGGSLVLLAAAGVSSVLILKRGKRQDDAN